MNYTLAAIDFSPCHCFTGLNTPPKKHEVQLGPTKTITTSSRTRTDRRSVRDT